MKYIRFYVLFIISLKFIERHKNFSTLFYKEIDLT